MTRTDFDTNFVIQTVRQPGSVHPEHFPTPDHGRTRLQEMARVRFAEWESNFLKALCGHIAPTDPEPAVLLFGSSNEHVRILRCGRCAGIAARALPRASDGLVQCRSCRSEWLPLTAMPRVHLPEQHLLIDVPCCAKCLQ